MLRKPSAKWPKRFPDNTQGLRMPSMQLPSFRRDSVVQDDISEFLSAKTSLSLPEQQCVGDWPRSVLWIAKTTKGYEGKAAEEKLNICIERLRVEFGESKEDKCRWLPAELSAIQQERGESVEQFTFKYKKLLHQLEKLGEKIAKDCPIFVISQFISKVSSLLWKHRNLKRSIRPLKRLVVLSCHFKLRPLPRMDEWNVTPNASVSSTAAVKPQLPNQHPKRQQRACYTCGETNHLSRYCPKIRKENSKQPDICRNYNRFPKSNCEEDGNKCKYGWKHQFNSAINGAVKPSNIRKIVCQVQRVALHLMRLILWGNSS